jgi:lipopolysaccharide export system protein LptA
MKFTLLILIGFLLSAESAFSQKKIIIKHADSSIGRPVGKERQDWLIGNVVFEQNQTTIYCDSAKWLKKGRSMEAYGRVRITDGDSVTLTASFLSYDGNTRIARLRKNVVFKKLNTATLYTEFLDFDRQRNMAKYFNGGKLVDSTNTLTSQKGYYDTRSNLASFKKDVVTQGKDFNMKSDTLQYHTKTKIIYFHDVTTVTDVEGKTATYTSGYYDTRSKLSNIHKGVIETQSYTMAGDSYFLDDKKLFYRATGNVVMTSKEENMTIHGEQGIYNKAKGHSKVFGNAYVAKVEGAGDTLFLTADTLVSIESKDPKKKRLLAYHQVKIFKTNMQGIADSLAYVSADSMLHFYYKPALWNEENQMTADTIRIRLRNSNIDKIYMLSNSFVASQDSLKNFNQIKGRLMTTHFRGQKIHHVDVSGNGQSLYFATEEKEIKDSTATARIIFLTGLNKIECSNMKINFVDGKVNNITFLKNPDAAFIPPHEITPADRLLTGFTWRGAERPKRGDVVKSSGAGRVGSKVSPTKTTQ